MLLYTILFPVTAKDYQGYLAQAVLEAGLKSGRFVQGRLQVNRYNAQQEAFVTPNK